MSIAEACPAVGHKKQKHVSAPDEKSSHGGADAKTSLSLVTIKYSDLPLVDYAAHVLWKYQ